MRFHTVLAASDFSPDADQAVAEAAGVASRTAAELVLLHVEPLAEPWPSGVIVSAGALSHLYPTADDRLERSRHELAQVAQRLAARGIPVRAQVALGRPDEVIVAAANERDADLVVVGTRGRTGLARTLLGSVASSVIRHGTRPVLVVRRRAGAGPAGMFRRVLVASDFSPASEAALELAVALAGDAAELELFHVRRTARSPEVARELEQACEATGRQWLARHAGPHRTFRFTQQSGSPAKRILERLEPGGGGYDLVALGAHGLRGFRRLTLGGTAEAVVRHAPCTTLLAYRP